MISVNANDRPIALMIESDGPGGAESVVLALARQYREAGLQVRPVVLAGGPGWLSSQLKEDGFRVYLPALRGPIDLKAVRKLAGWLKTEEVGFAHLHEFTMSVYGGMASKLAGIDFGITMHGGTGYARALRRRLALTAVARMAKAVVGVSASTADELASSLWIERDRICVVTNGIEPRLGNREDGRSGLSVGNDVSAILAVGNLYPVKGHDILIAAAAELKNLTGLPDWRVFIAGRGDQQELLESLIEHHGLKDNVTLLGLRQDVPDLLAAADLFVMPSRNEGLPMALLEAIFASCPVICSRVGGIPELLGGGRLGLLVEPENAIDLAAALAECLRSSEETRRRAREAYDVLSGTYSASAMALRYRELFSMSFQAEN